MTKREFYEAVINANINDEMTAQAQAFISGLNHTNELRKVSAEKKAAEKEAVKAPIREAIVACITEEPKTATTLIAEAGVEIKPQAIPSLLKGLVAEGVITKGEVKVTGKGKQVGYARA